MAYYYNSHSGEFSIPLKIPPSLPTIPIHLPSYSQKDLFITRENCLCSGARLEKVLVGRPQGKSMPAEILEKQESQGAK